MSENLPIHLFVEEQTNVEGVFTAQVAPEGLPIGYMRLLPMRYFQDMRLPEDYVSDMRYWSEVETLEDALDDVELLRWVVKCRHLLFEPVSPPNEAPSDEEIPELIVAHVEELAILCKLLLFYNGMCSRIPPEIPKIPEQDIMNLYVFLFGVPGAPRPLTSLTLFPVLEEIRMMIIDPVVVVRSLEDGPTHLIPLKVVFVGWHPDQFGRVPAVPIDCRRYYPLFLLEAFHFVVDQAVRYSHLDDGAHPQTYLGFVNYLLLRIHREEEEE